MELRVRNRYRLGRKIWSGSFGEIYLGKSSTDNHEVGIKLECVNAKHPQLMIEAKIYRLLQGGCKLHFSISSCIIHAFL